MNFYENRKNYISKRDTELPRFFGGRYTAVYRRINTDVSRASGWSNNQPTTNGRCRCGGSWKLNFQYLFCCRRQLISTCRVLSRRSDFSEIISIYKSRRFDFFFLIFFIALFNKPFKIFTRRNDDRRLRFV